MARLQLANSRSLPQRCIEIENIINSAGTQELKNALPSLLACIFGSASDSGWQLNIISSGYNVQEFESARRFLGPEGPVLKLVYSLQSDNSLLYEYPINHIPGPSRHIIEEGNVPYFYMNKLQTHGYGSHMLLLSAFEFYIFHFAHCLINWRSLSWNNLIDHLYPCLLDDYLNYFLPLKKAFLPPIPHQQSPIRSPVMHSKMYSPSPKINASPGRTLGLLKSTFLATQKQHSQNSSVLGQGEAEVWRSETLLQILTEFWLNQNGIDTAHGLFPNSHMWSQYLFTHLSEHFMPSLEHVRLVRMLLKHVHHFVNTATPEIITSPYRTQLMSPLDEFKRSIIPNMLQKSVYAFLRHCFDRWPLDNSFRMVLETWLTYIQPFRYTCTNKTSAEERDSDGDNKVVEDRWSLFIEDNLLFYSVLLQEFLDRVKRIDLMNVANSLMLYRVAKVFRLQNLESILRAAEQELCRSMYRSGHMTRDLGGSYLAPDSSLLLHSQISELEKPGFQYSPMFGEKTLNNVKQVLQQIQQVQKEIQLCQKSKPTRSGLSAFFFSLFEDNTQCVGDLSSAEVKKLQLYHDLSIKNLCCIFMLPETNYILKTDNSFHGNLSADFIDDCPDMCESDDGISLTPLGRYQLIMKQKRFEVFYTGDPDLQPIRSYENATIVRLLHQFCLYINTQFSNEIQTAYERQDILGRLAKVFFPPAIPKDQKPRSPISRSNLEVLRKPKLRLRFLGSYSTMTYLGLLFLFVHFWLGVGPVQFVLLVLLCTLCFGLLKALML